MASSPAYDILSFGILTPISDVLSLCVGYVHVRQLKYTHLAEMTGYLAYHTKVNSRLSHIAQHSLSRLNFSCESIHTPISVCAWLPTIYTTADHPMLSRPLTPLWMEYLPTFPSQLISSLGKIPSYQASTFQPIKDDQVPTLGYGSFHWR